MTATDQRLRHVLAGLSFPARRWQVIAEAEHYGADSRTRRELHTLPDARFESYASLLWALERARAKARAA
jgi:Protein of unknown function (DUF2795)